MVGLKSGQTSRVLKQNGISQACYIVEIYHSGPEPSISRVPNHNGISQACYIVEIYHSGPEPSISRVPNHNGVYLKHVI